MVIPTGDSIRYGWESVKQNLGFCITASLMLVAVGLGAYLIPMVLVFAGASGDGSVGIVLIGILLMTVASVLAGAFIYMAGINLGLIFCDGRVPEYSDMRNNSSRYGQLVIGTLVYMLMVTIGSIFCVFPGIYLGIRYFFYPFLIVDQDMDAMDAIRAAGELTRESMVETFGFLLAIYVLNLVGSLLCGIGLLVTVPITMIALSYVYRVLLAGKNAAAQQYAQPPITP